MPWWEIHNQITDLVSTYSRGNWVKFISNGKETFGIIEKFHHDDVVIKEFETNNTELINLLELIPIQPTEEHLINIGLEEARGWKNLFHDPKIYPIQIRPETEKHDCHLKFYLYGNFSNYLHFNYLHQFQNFVDLVLDIQLTFHPYNEVVMESKKALWRQNHVQNWFFLKTNVPCEPEILNRMLRVKETFNL